MRTALPIRCNGTHGIYGNSLRFSPRPSTDRPAHRHLDGGDSAMDSQIGHKFEDVQVHTDANAASAARQINARAFTSGKSIYFAPGEYQPETAAGRQLLAHDSRT